MLLSEFDYDLPEDRIAQVPCEPRDHSRLMVLNPQEQTVAHHHFYDLKKFLSPGDTLIFNDTRVMPARLIGHKDKTGGKIRRSRRSRGRCICSSSYINILCSSEICCGECRICR